MVKVMWEILGARSPPLTSPPTSPVLVRDQDIVFWVALRLRKPDTA